LLLLELPPVPPPLPELCAAASPPSLERTLPPAPPCSDTTFPEQLAAALARATPTETKAARVHRRPDGAPEIMPDCIPEIGAAGRNRAEPRRRELGGAGRPRRAEERDASLAVSSVHGRSALPGGANRSIALPARARAARWRRVPNREANMRFRLLPAL